MSKELVERLRKGPVAYQSESGPVYAGPTGDSAEAADLIERQSKIIEEAFGLLRQMDEAWCSGMDGDDVCAEYALRIRTLTNKADRHE